MISTKFYFTSAPPGSGKTKSLIQVTEDYNKAGENILYVAPTKLLCEQFHKAFKDSEYTHPILITGNTTNKPIKTIIEEVYKDQHIDKTIIITTQALIELLKNNNFPKKESYHLFMDESIDIFKTFSIKTSISSQLVFGNFIVSENSRNKDDRFVEIKSKDTRDSKKFINTILKNPQDDPLAKEYYNVVSEINNPYFYTYMLKKDYEKAIKGEKIETNIYSICLPEIFNGFKTVTFLRANFEKSMTYKIYKEENIKLEKNKNITDRLLYSEYPALTNTVIKYVTDIDYSKNFRNKGENEEEILKKIIMDDIGKDKFLITTNLDSNKFIKNIIKQFDLNGEYITPKADGRNDLMEHDKVVFLAVMNPKIEHAKGLENIGLNISDLKRDMYLEAVIQFIWRGKIRIEPEANYTIYVPDKRAALAIKDCNHIKKIEKIEANVKEERSTGRKRVFDDVKIRNKVSNTRQKIYKAMKENDYSFMYFLDKYSTTGLKMKKNSWEEFSEELHSYFIQNNDITDKNDNLLMSTGLFEANENSFRGMENHISSSFIILDFDKTKLTPKDVEQIDILKNVNMIHYSTSTKGNFRTVIDIDNSICALGYKTITRFIMEEIEYNYENKKCGIDKASANPTQLFYIPSSNETYSFFRKTGKLPMDTKKVIKNIKAGKILIDILQDEIEFEELCSMKIDTININDAQAASAMSYFNNIVKNKKHQSLIGLACGIKKANYPKTMAVTFMLQNEYCFKHKKDVETVIEKVYKHA